MASYPNDATGDALRRFEQNGFDLTKPMNIDFFVAVSSKKLGSEVAQKVKNLGFETSLEKDDDSGEWTCYCTKLLLAEYSNIIEIERELACIARLHDGYVHGFGTFGNT